MGTRVQVGPSLLIGSPILRNSFWNGRAAAKSALFKASVGWAAAILKVSPTGMSKIVFAPIATPRLATVVRAIAVTLSAPQRC